MSDFTPTAEHFRLAYLHYVHEHGMKPGRDPESEFNRGLAAHDAEVRASVVPEEPEATRLVDRRDPECVKAWPDCHTFGYDPACCRFPKSCSAGDFERTTNHEIRRQSNG